MADRRANPREDLLTVIAHSKLDDELLPQEYLDGSWLLIIFAGNDTTRNTMSGSIYGLNKFGDQYDKLIANPKLIPNMVAEIVRWQTPVIHMRRTALEDYELGGQQIKTGDKVVMWYASGNRDEAVFEDAEKLIIDRKWRAWRGRR